jgi:hypothetical protein
LQTSGGQLGSSQQQFLRDRPRQSAISSAAIAALPARAVEVIRVSGRRILSCAHIGGRLTLVRQRLAVEYQQSEEEQSARDKQSDHDYVGDERLGGRDEHK